MHYVALDLFGWLYSLLLHALAGYCRFRKHLPILDSIAGLVSCPLYILSLKISLLVTNEKLGKKNKKQKGSLGLSFWEMSVNLVIPLSEVGSATSRWTCLFQRTLIAPMTIINLIHCLGSLPGQT